MSRLASTPGQGIRPPSNKVGADPHTPLTPPARSRGRGRYPDARQKLHRMEFGPSRVPRRELNDPEEVHSCTYNMLYNIIDPLMHKSMRLNIPLLFRTKFTT